MDSTIIRKAQEVDLPALIAFCKESLLAGFSDLVDADKLLPWAEGGDIEKYVKGIWPSTLLAMSGPDLMGMLCLQHNHVDIIWVTPALREQGVGKQLMEVAEDQVALAYDSITVECLGPDIETLEFYQRRGYTKQKEYEDNMSGVDKIVMSRPLVEVD